MDKKIEDFSDLELAEISGQLYTEFMRIQANLQAVNSEIARRKETKETDKKKK